MSLDSHCFALYATKLHESLVLVEPPAIYRVADPTLVHRIHTVLRLRPDENLVLFDDTYKIEAKLVRCSSKEILILSEKRVPHEPLRPAITWWLPLLKREAFEQALYSLTEMGATTIQPIQTEKTARSWGSPKDYSRARSIMVAAAEQSKQFVLPKLMSVQDVRLCTVFQGSVSILLDAGGGSIKKLLLAKDGSEVFTVCSGPEGDFTTDEKKYLENQGFIVCRLTPSILRAQEAVAVGLGILRSWYH